MPMIRQKPTAKDNLGDLKCSWKMVYVPPRNFKELKAEIAEHYEKLTRVGLHYSETEGCDALALICLMQADEVGRMIGKKFTRKETKALRKASDVCFARTDKYGEKT